MQQQQQPQQVRQRLPEARGKDWGGEGDDHRDAEMHQHGAEQQPVQLAMPPPLPQHAGKARQGRAARPLPQRRKARAAHQREHDQEGCGADDRQHAEAVLEQRQRLRLARHQPQQDDDGEGAAQIADRPAEAREALQLVRRNQVRQEGFIDAGRGEIEALRGHEGGGGKGQRGQRRPGQRRDGKHKPCRRQTQQREPGYPRREGCGDQGGHTAGQYGAGRQGAPGGGGVGEARQLLLKIDWQQHGGRHPEIDGTGNVIARPGERAPVEPAFGGRVSHLSLVLPRPENHPNCIA